MKSLSTAAALQSLHEQPLWRLLAADKAPLYIALLQALLLEGDKTLPVSVMYERLATALEYLRAHGHDLQQTAQAYVSDWLAKGWLTRRLPPGAAEEELELSAEATSALRFVGSILRPRVTATESRLATVIQQLTRLAEETDDNPKSRVEALLAERERIDREIAAIRTHGVKALPQDRALERAREIIALSDELAGDFRNVRDAFDKLNRSLRQSLMENEGSRGDVLEALFAGVDLIGESEAGRTFTAFWRLLTDGEQSAALNEALDEVVSRPFARRLEARERKFLQNLTGMLVDQGSDVHEVLQSFARSLKSFVQSREFLEQRRLHALLKETQHQALAVRDRVRPNEPVGYLLSLTSSQIRSVSQTVLFDPSLRLTSSSMLEAEPSELQLDEISRMVRESEIDFRSLRENIRTMLEEQSQASIGQLLDRFPARQGLGTVVGYVSLGAKHGEVTASKEVIRWQGQDGVARQASLPTRCTPVQT